MRRNPKLSLGKILTLGPSSKDAVEAGELRDLFLADLLSFVAEAFFASWSRTRGRRSVAPCRGALGTCGW